MDAELAFALLLTGITVVDQKLPYIGIFQLIKNWMPSIELWWTKMRVTLVHML